jgi:hypothetical protein
MSGAGWRTYWPLLGKKLAATNVRCLAEQVEPNSSAVDTRKLAAVAAPTLLWQRRIPGLQLFDDRDIRSQETLLHPGFVREWTSRELQASVVAQHSPAGQGWRSDGQFLRLPTPPLEHPLLTPFWEARQQVRLLKGLTNVVSRLTS